MSNLFPDPLGAAEPIGGTGIDLAPPGMPVPTGYPGGEPFGPNGSAATPDLRNLPLATVDSDESVSIQLAMQLGQHAVPFASIEALATKLTGAPLVVVLGPSMASADQLAVVERVGEMLTTGGQPTNTGAGTDLVGFNGTQEPGEQGQVITVFSTKGGAGKSMIACNVAVRLAKKSSGMVALVDADLQFGDVAVMLKLAPQHTIVDAVGSLDRIDANLLQSLLVTHEPSGLQVLPAPLEPAFADQIRGEEMVRIVELLRTFCTHVVIDTPAYFNDVVLGLIEVSDDVLLVAGMDIPNIKNVKIGLQTLRLLNTPLSKLKLILNRANSKVKLDVSEVERTLQIKADCLIPSDIAVPQSVNQGTPVVLDAPKSGVAKSIEQLADLFLVDADAKRRRR